MGPPKGVSLLGRRSGNGAHEKTDPRLFSRSVFEVSGVYRDVVVEMARVELASKSISTGLSPSAVDDLVVRFSGRPSTSYQIGYLVVPHEYRELLTSFPV